MDSPRSLRQLGIDCLVKTRRLKQSAPANPIAFILEQLTDSPVWRASCELWQSSSHSHVLHALHICLGDQRRHSISGSYSSVDWTVATQAERDQIVFMIRAGVAAKLFVVDFKVGHGTAQLTAPAVSPQYVLAELLVILLLEPDRRLFRLHWICSFTICRKACR